MSLLSIAKSCAEEVGLPAPSIVNGSTDKTAKQLKRLINRSGLLLAKKNWTVLQKEYTFTTTTAAEYSLPDDFERLLDETVWDRSQYWDLRGPLSPKDWQVYKSGLIANTGIRRRFRIKRGTAFSTDNKFVLDPTPAAGVSMVFEYASTFWASIQTPVQGLDPGRASLTADTDFSLISEELIEMDVIWRLLNRKGLAYAEEYNETRAAIDRAFADDGGAPVLNMGVPHGGQFLSNANLPEGGFG